MQTMYYIGLDVHKRTISYCVKDGSGRVYAEGSVPAARLDLDRWMKTLPQPWTAAMEATVFTGWIYDHLQPHAAARQLICCRFTRRINGCLLVFSWLMPRAYGTAPFLQD
jgi:hypothetical protein